MASDILSASAVSALYAKIVDSIAIEPPVIPEALVGALLAEGGPELWGVFADGDFPPAGLF
jgi:hypothetical protein